MLIDGNYRTTYATFQSYNLLCLILYLFNFLFDMYSSIAYAIIYALHSGITVAHATPYLTSIYNIKRDGYSFLSKVHIWY